MVTTVTPKGNPQTDTDLDSPPGNPDAAVELLAAIFDESDRVLYRPIECWTEDGKKKSRVHYKATMHRRAVPGLIQANVSWLLDVAEATRCNLYFGVCPRAGGEGEFDLEWQIRCAPALWADVDDVTVDEALWRVKEAGLPVPSAVVATGGGAHLYWFLTTPYVVDDIGDPPRVLTEWVELPNGKKASKKFILDGDERVYLTDRQDLSRLSEKALRLKDIVAGIAQAIAGDHTTDLSRLLRLPGTFNRKDERNGRQPVLAELIECDPSRRYELSVFEPFSKQSEDTKHAKEIAAAPLPKPKRTITAKGQKKLDSLIYDCNLAKPGSRSEVDFSLACYCIRTGIARETVWPLVSHVGKFAEAGRRYFDRTWESAEHDVRSGIFEEAQKRAEKKQKKQIPSGGAGSEDDERDKEGVIKRLADAICETDHFAHDVGDRLWHYVGGVYKPKGERDVKRLVQSLCKEWNESDKWSKALQENVIEYINVASPLLPETPDRNLVNVQNGILNVETKQLLPHDPAFLSYVQLPIKYDPMATCSFTEKFVSQVFPADAVDLAWEVAAWLMTSDMSIQKAVLLTGEGGNGKSRWLAQLTAFLGSANVSARSLHQIENNRFTASGLVGKLANICPDLPGRDLESTSIFKAVTGGDRIPAESKHKPEFEFSPFCGLVFSANHLPRSQDASEAFFDRWVVIPFDAKFRGTSAEIPKEQLDAKLADPTELSGLLNKALAALPGLRKRGRFTQPQSVVDAVAEFRSATDPFAVWLDRNTIQGAELFVVCDRLRRAYAEHCDRTGKPTISVKKFGSRMKQERPEVTREQRTVNGKAQTGVYVGIGLASEHEDSQSHESRDSGGKSDDGCVEPRESRDFDTSDSRDSRDYPYLHVPTDNYSNPSGICGNEDEEGKVKNPAGVGCKKGQSRESRDRVICQSDRHEWADTLMPDGRIHTGCRACGKFRGYRPADNTIAQKGA